MTEGSSTPDSEAAPAGKSSVAPERTVGRLSLYRRILGGLLAERPGNVYSHQLAEAAGVTAALVRRDLMSLGYSGSPKHGYDVRDLLRSIDEYLDAPEGQRVALVGVGNLGRALLAYFRGRRPKLDIRAAFDSDSAKVDTVVSGCKVHHISRFQKVVKSQRISIVIIAVPAPEAQGVAELCARAGARGILNFAPIPLKVPPQVYVSDIDLTMALEKAAFFARHPPQAGQHRDDSRKSEKPTKPGRGEK